MASAPSDVTENIHAQVSQGDEYQSQIKSETGEEVYNIKPCNSFFLLGNLGRLLFEMLWLFFLRGAHGVLRAPGRLVGDEGFPG